MQICFYINSKLALNTFPVIIYRHDIQKISSCIPLKKSKLKVDYCNGCVAWNLASGVKTSQHIYDVSLLLILWLHISFAVYFTKINIGERIFCAKLLKTFSYCTVHHTAHAVVHFLFLRVCLYIAIGKCSFAELRKLSRKVA